MATILNNNMRAMFPTSGEGAKSDAVANILIERVLRGDYSGTREYGPADDLAHEMQIIGTMYLMAADESTLTIRPDVEAFVLRLEHEPRLVDYYEFLDVEQGRAFMTAKG